MIDAEEYVYWVLRYYVPAMVANAMPVLIKGSRLIDRGRLFIDGKPVLGVNKTWEGFLIGVVGSYITGSCIGFVVMDYRIPFLSLGVGVMALMGDMVGAFIKRRLGLKPGEPAPILDQLDFALATTLFYFLIGLDEVISRSLYIFITLLLIFTLHVVSNLLAYLLGLKQSKF